MKRFKGIVVVMAWLLAVPLLAADWNEAASDTFDVVVPEPAALMCALAALVLMVRAKGGRQ